MTPAQAREVLTRLLSEDPPLAVHLRQGDPPHHEIEDEVAAFVPTEGAEGLDEGPDLEEIRAALVRLDLGTWGACGSCGEPIDAERLTRLPYARSCTGCAPT